MPATDFLSQHQPSAATVRALWYLHTFFQHKPWQDGCAHEQALRDCRLDYTTASLQRLDSLLDELHRSSKPDSDTFFNDLANQNFLSLIAFYSGELLGRALRQAPVWLPYESFAERVPLLAASHPPALWTDLAALFPDSNRVFFPLQAVFARLFDGSGSLYEAFCACLDETPPETHTRLPEAPPQSLNFSIRHAIANTSLRDLPYLQMLPPSDLAHDARYFQIDALGTLYRQGRSVWAALVEADPALRKAENFHARSARIVYDPSGRTDPETLLQAAKTLAALDEPSEDEENAESKTPAPRSPFPHKIPYAVSHMPLYTADILIWRPHLPDGILRRRQFPILIDDSARAVTLLPARYWAHTEYYQSWQNPEQPAEPEGETAPAFAAILADDADFWKNYPELVRPLPEELPDLADNASPYTAEYSDTGKQRIRNYRTAAQSSYPRFSEDLPDETDIQNCVEELQAIGNTAYPPRVEKYARLRLADLSGILAELDNPAANAALQRQPVAEAVTMLGKPDAGAYAVSRFAHSLMKQSRSNSTAAVYLAYCYATAKLLPQSLYEAAYWAQQAADSGDWRGTQLLAEILLAAPQAAPELLYERISQEAYALLPELKTVKLSAKEVEAEKKAYLNDSLAVSETIRSLFRQAAEQGHPIARVRLKQLTEAGILSAEAAPERYHNIRNWLSASGTPLPETAAPAAVQTAVPAEQQQPEQAAPAAAAPVKPRRSICCPMLAVALLAAVLLAAYLFYYRYLTASDLHNGWLILQEYLRAFWHGLKAFMRDLMY